MNNVVGSTGDRGIESHFCPIQAMKCFSVRLRPVIDSRASSITFVVSSRDSQGSGVMF